MNMNLNFDDTMNAWFYHIVNQRFEILKKIGDNKWPKPAGANGIPGASPLPPKLCRFNVGTFKSDPSSTPKHMDLGKKPKKLQIKARKKVKIKSKHE